MTTEHQTKCDSSEHRYLWDHTGHMSTKPALSALVTTLTHTSQVHKKNMNGTVDFLLCAKTFLSAQHQLPMTQ